MSLLKTTNSGARKNYYWTETDLRIINHHNVTEKLCAEARGSIYFYLRVPKRRRPSFYREWQVK